MKSFVISLLIFTILLGTIAINHYFINRTADELENRLQALSVKENEAALEELWDYWSKKREAISLSVPTEEIQALTERLTELQCAGRSRNEEEFEKSRALALCAVTELRRLERIASII